MADKVLVGEPSAGGGGGAGATGPGKPIHFYTQLQAGGRLVSLALLAPKEFLEASAQGEFAENAAVQVLAEEVKKHPYLGKPQELSDMLRDYSYFSEAPARAGYGICCELALGEEHAGPRLFYDLPNFFRIPPELATLYCAATRFALSKLAPGNPKDPKHIHYTFDTMPSLVASNATSSLRQLKDEFAGLQPVAGGVLAVSRPFRPFSLLSAECKYGEWRVAKGSVEYQHLFPQQRGVQRPSIQEYCAPLGEVLKEMHAVRRSGWQNSCLFPTLLRGAARAALDEVEEERGGQLALTRLRFSGAKSQVQGDFLHLTFTADEGDLAVRPAPPPPSPNTPWVPSPPLPKVNDVLSKHTIERVFREVGPADRTLPATGRIVVKRYAGMVHFEEAPEGGFHVVPEPELRADAPPAAGTGRYVPPSMRPGGGAAGGGGGGQGAQQAALAPLVAGIGSLALAPPMGEAQQPPPPPPAAQQFGAIQPRDWKRDKGFGFIRAASSSIFVHRSSCDGAVLDALASPNAGPLRVVYELAQDKEGRSVAVNVRLDSGSAAGGGAGGSKKR